MVKFQFLSQFPVDNLAHPIVSSLIFFLDEFVAFAYYEIDRFVSITTSPAVLLRFIYSCFDMIGPYGVVLSCYKLRFSFSLKDKYYYHLLFDSFSHPRYLMVFHWSLSDGKSPQVSRNLLSILAVLNNTVVWMVSIRPPTSKSSIPFNNPLVTVPKAPIIIGIIIHSLELFTSVLADGF